MVKRVTERASRQILSERRFSAYVKHLRSFSCRHVPTRHKFIIFIVRFSKKDLVFLSNYKLKPTLNISSTNTENQEFYVFRVWTWSFFYFVNKSFQSIMIISSKFELQLVLVLTKICYLYSTDYINNIFSFSSHKFIKPFFVCMYSPISVTELSYFNDNPLGWSRQKTLDIE